MIHEIDSSELIASLVEYKKAKRQLQSKYAFDFSLLADLARKLEEKCPSIIVDMDRFSIESFRCQCSRGIEVSSSQIILDLQIPNMDSLLRQCKPEKDYYTSIIEILGEDC